MSGSSAPSTEGCTSASVLCERPGADRSWTPETGVMLWYCMAAAIAVLIAVGVAYWVTPKVRRGEKSD